VAKVGPWVGAAPGAKRPSDFHVFQLGFDVAFLRRQKMRKTALVFIRRLILLRSHIDGFLQCRDRISSIL
jgi:hypothetical protein